jgi:NAD(P)-dependent dehydrogenase (short-subunit alcohol dehydrogenase family)
MTNTNNAPKPTRVFLVTGAYGAIGKAIARQLATGAEHQVVLVGRDAGKCRRAAEEISQATGNERVGYEVVDISRQAEIAALARRWEGPLHVLLNNAGTTPRKRLETPEGIEMQLATNVLGYFWMTQAFEQILAASAPARVVNVASYWAGNLDLTDLEFKRRRYDNNLAYRQSKQANRMLSVAFSERLASSGITVNACHPGDVNSKLSTGLGFGGGESPDSGARTPVWLASDPAGQESSGAYFEHLRPVRDQFAGDRPAIKALYDACTSYGPDPSSN